MTESRPSISSGADDPPDEPQPPPVTATHEMRSEVNAYAGAILVKLLAIVNEMPGRRRDEVQRIEREIRQMLAFIDPQLDRDFGDLPRIAFPDDDTAELSSASPPTRSQIDERVEALIGRIERADLQGESSTELLRDLRETVYTLRDDIRAEHDETAEALRTLTSTTRSLHYTVTALTARSEQITDVSGIAEEQIRVGVWKYALLAGLSSGAVVAAVVAFLNLVT